MTTESFCPKLPAIWRPECTLRVKGHLTTEGRMPFFADKSRILIIVGISTCLVALLGVLTCACCCCGEKKDGELETVTVTTRAISPIDDTSSENTDRDRMADSCKGTSRSSGRAVLHPSDSGQANTSDRGGQSDRAVVEFHPDTRRESDKIRSKKAYVALGMPQNEDADFEPPSFFKKSY